ncbi:SDR family NAD(P)-dependent oxidoreductase [Dactylosporangium sp. NPDC050588]|uniref:SDR family NAD(P)-dependent oxidoreductase n=1 Tax=Dactylosporangium sp. NPDC050588 TaxID=3157211 RepID=UPI00340B0F30
MRTWFVTGGTPGGFGQAYADAALETGDRVVLTARRPEELREWARPYGDRVLVLPLDVTDAAQVCAAVAEAEQRMGGIDVLVNNAGRGWYGSIEGMAEDAVRRTSDLNFFALLSVTRAVLPGMRERRRGWIVNMSSVAGVRIAAMAEDPPPRRLVLGSDAYDAVTSTLREALTDITWSEAASCAADFPPGT